MTLSHITCETDVDTGPDNTPTIASINATNDSKNHYRDWQGTVVDICFNGILINGRSLPTERLATEDSNIASTIHFESGIDINAHLELVHQHDDFYGFRFAEIDSDSLSHLKKLVMLNLGDEACQRELMSLFSYHQ